MMNKGKIVIVAETIAEAERDLQMMKMAVASGRKTGCGATTPEGLAKAVAVGEMVMNGGCNCDCCDEDTYGYQVNEIVEAYYNGEIGVVDVIEAMAEIATAIVLEE